MNVLRLSLHPIGLAPQIANLAQWRAHLFERVRHQIAISADPALITLLEELRAYPIPECADLHLDGEHPGVVMPFQFSTPLPELAMETFFPADDATRQALLALAARGSES